MDTSPYANTKEKPFALIRNHPRLWVLLVVSLGVMDSIGLIGVGATYLLPLLWISASVMTLSCLGRLPQAGIWPGFFFFMSTWVMFGLMSPRWLEFTIAFGLMVTIVIVALIGRRTVVKVGLPELVWSWWILVGIIAAIITSILGFLLLIDPTAILTMIASEILFLWAAAHLELKR